MNGFCQRLCAVAGLLLSGFAHAAPVGAGNGDSEALVLAGRALYRGELPFSAPSRLQGVALPAAHCSQCHGPRGGARQEAGVRVPAIQWQPLMQASDGLPAYRSSTQVLQAIGRGQGRQGQALAAPMPQFALTTAEQQALLAYLRVVGTDAQPIAGVTAERVVVASVLPLSGPQAAAGERIRAAMAARFDAINAQGGVFGRRIELRAIDGGATSASASAALRATLVGKQDVFALVGSLLPDPDGAALKLLQSREMPMVATLGIAQAEPQSPQLTYLLPPLQAQLQGLADEMGKHCPASDGVRRLIHPDAAALGGLISLALPHWQAVAVSASSLTAAQANGPAARQVIALVRRDELAALHTQWNAPGGPDCVGTLAVVSGQSPSRGLAHYAEAVALPMPAVVQDSALPAGAALWPVLGDMAARVFAETLARAGRSVDPQGFADALNTLHRFQPVAGLTVTFGPKQRHGFDVTYFWREKAHDTSSKTP